MSIFPPEENIVRPIFPPCCGSAKTAEELFYEVQGRYLLSIAESDRLKKFCEYNLQGDGLINLMPTLMSNGGVIVEISEDQKGLSGSVSGQFPDYPIDPYVTEEGAIIVLGEYCRQPKRKNKGKITLYLNNIRLAAEENKMRPAFLLVSVYAHELYHAYFHREMYVPELEEPLAEYGSLLYIHTLHSIRVIGEKELESLVKMVEKKKGGILEYYNLGAYLFQYKVVDESLPQIIDKYKVFDLSRLFDPGTLAELFRKYKGKPTVDSLMDIFQGAS